MNAKKTDNDVTPLSVKPHGPADPAAANPVPVKGRAVEPSRAGSFWVGTVLAAVILIALLIFIGQNSQQVQIDFLGLSGHFSLAIALLVALVGGILIVAIPGGLRILQLRHKVKKATRT